MKVGIIGYGYVGRAIASAYHSDNILINDPAHADSASYDDLTSQCKAIFVCVPTPAGPTGDCDTSILEDVLARLSGYTGLVISKSTASPQVYEMLERTSGLRLVHVPEFLTQSNAVYDYLNPQKIVIGGDNRLWNEAAHVVVTDKMNWKGSVECCSIGEASFFKYLANTMLAMKVVINNEYFKLSNKLGLRWNIISSIASGDHRLGNSHWSVPGPDGSMGFGGACFPKDAIALAALAEDLDVEMSMLNQALIRNSELRS